MKNNTSLRIPKKYHARIDEVTRENCDDFERNLAYVIYLSPGWCAGDDFGVHTLIEYSQKETLARLRGTVRCNACDDCALLERGDLVIWQGDNAVDIANIVTEDTFTHKQGRLTITPPSGDPIVLAIGEGVVRKNDGGYKKFRR